MKIAVIGSGISGLTAAYLLSKEHEVHLFEKNNYIGGHTNTIDVTLQNENHHIDTGFIVFNEKTYPNFCHLLNQLNIKSETSNMSFSVSCEKTGLEYNGTSLNSLFAQRSNIFKPSFLRLISDILRFGKKTTNDKFVCDENITLGEYLNSHGFSDNFSKHYILPMASAVWSTNIHEIKNFPMINFIQFFKNHGMLSVNNRPMWRVISGGSKQYIPAFTKNYADKIYLNSTVSAINRTKNNVELYVGNEQRVNFDQVVIATHSDQALKLLSDLSSEEENILNSFSYKRNTAILHYDEKLLPSNRLAWASWNYHLFNNDAHDALPTVTYYMNILQNIKSNFNFCVSLNCDDRINGNKLIKKIMYEHPQYSTKAFRAQQHHNLINGVNRTYFCGAYWGYGFHEDGVNSALSVANKFGIKL